MQVKDVMSTKTISVAPEESAAVAARLLSRYNIGSLPVCTHDGKLRGVVTDRDIVVRCVANDDDPHQTKVSEIMTRRVISVSPTEDTSAATERMAHAQIRRLPVEDGGRVVGMVSLGDIVKLPDCSTEAAQALCDISRNIAKR